MKRSALLSEPLGPGCDEDTCALKIHCLPGQCPIGLQARVAELEEKLANEHEAFRFWSDKATSLERENNRREARIVWLEHKLADERSEIERVLREYAVEVEMDRPNKGFSDYIEAAADLVAARGESNG